MAVTRTDTSNAALHAPYLAMPGKPGEVSVFIREIITGRGRQSYEEFTVPADSIKKLTHNECLLRVNLHMRGTKASRIGFPITSPDAYQRVIVPNDVLFPLE
jgi:hypothetical protein